jgi:DNA-binding Xre family transcriptional regulator
MLMATPLEHLKAFLLTDEQSSELHAKGKLRIFTDFLNKADKKLRIEIELILLPINDKKLLLVLSRETPTVRSTAETLQQDPGKKLQLVMINKNRSTSELAAQTGLSMATISNLRTGKIKKPQALTAQLICEALEVDMSEIWNYVDK